MLKVSELAVFFNTNSTRLPELRDLPGGGANIAPPPPTISKSSALTKKNYKENISSLTINIQGGGSGSRPLPYYFQK